MNYRLNSIIIRAKLTPKQQQYLGEGLKRLYYHWVGGCCIIVVHQSNAFQMVFEDLAVIFPTSWNTKVLLGTNQVPTLVRLDSDDVSSNDVPIDRSQLFHIESRLWSCIFGP